MANNTIAPVIRSWSELWQTDREVLYVSEVATLLGLDPRTVTSSIESGDLPGRRVGRKILVPRTALLEALGITRPAA